MNENIPSSIYSKIYLQVPPVSRRQQHKICKQMRNLYLMKFNLLFMLHYCSFSNFLSPSGNIHPSLSEGGNFLTCYFDSIIYPVGCHYDDALDLFTVDCSKRKNSWPIFFLIHYWKMLHSLGEILLNDCVAYLFVKWRVINENTSYLYSWFN